MRYFTTILIILFFTNSYCQDSWIIDKNGCKVHNPYPRKFEAVEWIGNCKDGLADGEGKLVWSLYGIKTKNIFEGFINFFNYESVIFLTIIILRFRIEIWHIHDMSNISTL